jgi:hypothetical protein
MAYLRLIIIGSAVAFLVGTISLHLLQPDYDPINQLISELALGQYGIIMLFAFIALASSIGTLAFVIWRRCANITLPAVLLIGAACFAGAGILPIDVFNEAHIIFVFCAFVMCGLGMYLLPGCLNSSSKTHDRMISWGLGGMLVFTVLVGQVSLPGGIAQRLEAAILLMWVVVIAWKTTR